MKQETRTICTICVGDTKGRCAELAQTNMTCDYKDMKEGGEDGTRDVVSLICFRLISLSPVN